MENINKSNNKKQLVILTTVGALILLIGIGLGVVFQMQNKTQVENRKAVNSLSSKVVSSITAYGQVKNIEGRNITLSNLGDNLTISIANNAQAYSFSTPTTADKNGKVTTGVPVQKTVKFGDIKVGDNVNIAIKLLPTGQVQGQTVVILPAQ